jgi:TonB family protein
MAFSAGLLPQAVLGQKQEHTERKVIARVEPVYPELAKHMHISGIVRLEVLVRPNGSVKSVKVLGGNPVLVDPASDAVRQWKFEATNGETNEILQLAFNPQQ